MDKSRLDWEKYIGMDHSWANINQFGYKFSLMLLLEKISLSYKTDGIWLHRDCQKCFLNWLLNAGDAIIPGQRFTIYGGTVLYNLPVLAVITY